MKVDLMKIGLFAYFLMYSDVLYIPTKERTIMVAIVAIGFFVDWYTVKFLVEVYYRKWFKKKHK